MTNEFSWSGKDMKRSSRPRIACCCISFCAASKVSCGTHVITVKKKSRRNLWVLFASVFVSVCLCVTLTICFEIAWPTRYAVVLSSDTFQEAAFSESQLLAPMEKMLALWVLQHRALKPPRNGQDRPRNMQNYQFDAGVLMQSHDNYTAIEFMYTGNTNDNSYVCNNGRERSLMLFVRLS